MLGSVYTPTHITNSLPSINFLPLVVINPHRDWTEEVMTNLRSAHTLTHTHTHTQTRTHTVNKIPTDPEAVNSFWSVTHPLPLINPKSLMMVPPSVWNCDATTHQDHMYVTCLYWSRKYKKLSVYPDVEFKQCCKGRLRINAKCKFDWVSKQQASKWLLSLKLLLQTQSKFG